MSKEESYEVEDEVIEISEQARGRTSEGEFEAEDEDFHPHGNIAESTEEPLSAKEEIPEQGASADSKITSIDQIESAIESIVFSSPNAISVKKIKSLLRNTGFDETPTQDVLESLQQRYEERGIQLIKIAGGYQFRTNPQNAPILTKLLEDKPAKLSKSALEVLAIITYKQPVTRSEIDAVRGIDSGHLMRGLIEKNLVRTSGHADTPGRPFLYSTTQYFLEVFSLGSLDDLPSLEDSGRELGDADTMEADADFFDKNSPLAADPDRGDFDEPSEEEVIHPDFSSGETDAQEQEEQEHAESSTEPTAEA